MDIDVPLTWNIVSCDHCLKMSYISIVDEWDTDDRFCPNCGIASNINEDAYDYQDDFDYNREE